MRLILAVALMTCGLALAPNASWQAQAVPGLCPPVCDAIGDAAWIDAAAVPLYGVYHWPGLAGVAVTARAPRFGFEAVCGTPAVANDPRDYAVAARAVVPNPAGQWQLRVQVLHWRGDIASGGPIASLTVQTARARLGDCQLTAPLASPSITTSEPNRIAAVISVPGQRVMHQYLLADPSSSTIAELSMWSALPPQVAWPAVSDAQVLDAMAAPLCNAYIGSCR